MKTIMNVDEIYSFDEVATMLKTSKQQLRKLLNDGEIKGFKLGKYKWKIPKQSVQDYIKKKMS